MRNDGENNAGACGKTASRSTKIMISPWQGLLYRSRYIYLLRCNMARDCTISIEYKGLNRIKGCGLKMVYIPSSISKR
jgi:hypothetical protein